ncbi:OTU domain-containing protein 4-like isoform X3 [Dendronephthya gigantea]|uniref:OTU domain-containing protein 4-like isoform X3 n=1 Tax=Dendronephthya gigantea TaxID=151771 RepID=UPI00106DA2EB|nr:OTU domain-containing protein 4-like isoform X3 [Dendronephthya gigantea]
MERRERKKDLSTNMNHEAAMDAFLGKLGLYRKPIAKDGSCLFRAVAEQIFNCQAEHSRVRKECIEYMKKNKDRFEAFVEGPFDHHLFNLRSQKEWAGQVEIQALSLLYKCDFLVYKDINSGPIKATENDHDKKIILCYSNGNHYDSIYPFSHKNNLGLCQSIVFELLYGKVFPILMTKDPEKKATSPTDKHDKQDDFGENTLVNGYGTGSENGEENDEGWTTVKSRKQGSKSTKNQKNVDHFYSDQAPLSPASSKLSWEVMRSIDPDGYRNIELEVWEETRKEQQHKDQAVAATFQFKKGDRCQVKHPHDEKLYLAIIDDVLDEKCKIWIPELKERKLMPFSRLKPKEQNANTGYRELSGYYKKQENSQDNNSPRGGDDQKSGRRRKSNKNRKSNASDVHERGQHEDDLSGKPRGEKNRRRRNNSNSVRSKEEKKEFGQKENGNNSQGQASSEGPAFPALPALPKREDQPVTEKVKPDSDNNPDPATFWRKRREVEQMEKTTSDLKEVSFDVESSPVAVEDGLLDEESEKIIKDDVVKNQEEKNDNEWSDVVHQKIVEDLPYDIPNELPPDVLRQDAEEKKQDKAQDEPQLEGVREIKPVSIEKRVNWQDLQHNQDKSTACPPHDDSGKSFENMNINSETNQSNEQSTPVHVNNRQPLKETVIEMGDVEDNLEERSYNSMNRAHFDTQRNYEILRNPSRQDVQDEQTSNPLSRYPQTENAVIENENVEQATEEQEESSVFQMTDHTVQANDASLVDNDEKEDTPVNATPDPINHHPITAATIQTAIMNGSITYSNDPEGKDLHKDMEIVRHLYNYGIYMYQYFNSVFPSSTPMSPVFSVMNPNAMYAMQQSYQNRAMMMPPNVYPSMQQQTHDENQHRQSPSEETRENNDSPGYKPSISLHQPPSYQTSHAMAAAAQQQAMFSLNYGQMYATAGRPLYSNYNMFPQRSTFPRYPPNKMNFNRQAGRKFNNRYASGYARHDQQLPNGKLQNIPSGYGVYQKEAE